MAEAPAWNSQVLCRYYLHGVCRKGDRCTYSHATTAKTDMVCRYYLQGKCIYKEECRYDHVRPKHPPTPSSPESPSQVQSSLVSASSRCELTQKGVNCSTIPSKAESPENKGEEARHAESMQVKKSKWLDAAEFVPGQPWKGSVKATYLEAAKAGIESVVPDDGDTVSLSNPSDQEKATELCPYAQQGECRFGENCLYLHGNVCDLCSRAALHPTDAEQREQHISECVKRHEKDMELSFAVARSTKKTCGICMEVVMDKAISSDRRFGLLSNCSHVFCLSCIRKWRSGKHFDSTIVRSCPECRVKSDFVTPSKYWVEDKLEKEMLVEQYKTAMKSKPCKYFKQGRGECPFNNNCFYLHAYPDGRKASPQPVRRSRRQNADGDIDVVGQLLFWDFLEQHHQELDFEDAFEALLLSASLWDDSDTDSDFSDDF